MTIAIGADHAGFEYKQRIIDFLQNEGHVVKDYGCKSVDAIDYPDVAHPVAEAVEGKEFQYGILICGSANGVAITANKHQDVRAAICWNEELAELAKKHNNANILCLPARFISYVLSEKIVRIFLLQQFEGGRHQRRVDKISC
jgi:ribose 5-phosphate isomerase B